MFFYFFSLLVDVVVILSIVSVSVPVVIVADEILANGVYYLLHASAVRLLLLLL